MKIVAFNGSSRGRMGDTQMMVRAFLRGAAEAGAETENVFLAEKRIRHCQGCISCWTNTPGRCIIEDDMRSLLVKFDEADMVVLATPLCVDNVSGVMKDFIDRLLPRLEPCFERIGGEWRHAARLGEGPRIVAMASCGFPGQSRFQVLEDYFRRMAFSMHCRLVGEIYRGEGPLLSSTDPEIRKIVKPYLDLVNSAGRQIVEEGCVSEATAEALEEPLMPCDVYVARVRAMRNRSLGKKETR